jgi:hypothetical protein
LVTAQKREQLRKEAALQAQLELQSHNSTPLSQLPETINGTRKRKRGPRSQISSSGVVKRKIDYGANINSLQLESSGFSKEPNSVVESVYTPFSFGLSPDVSGGRRSL